MSEASPELNAAPRIVGRYALFDEIAAGGMATVHLGRLVGQVGFSRTVAVKRLHPQYAKDKEFVTMFVDEARLASRIQHPNVVSTLDVTKTANELFLVMEYVQGEALSKLVRNAAKRGERIPPNIVLSVMSGMLHGLHAAHEAKSETREPLNIVHRDISPQNVLVGLDGVARVLDFGVAKAAMRSGATRDGQMKGKLSYMSPEQLNGKDIDRRSDVFAAGIVLWEALAGKRLFAGADAGEILGKVLASEIPTPKSVVPSLPDAVSEAVMRSLERDPDKRFQTARDFAVALEKNGPLATAHSVGEWVREYGGEELTKRLNLVARVESHPMEELGEVHSGIEPVPAGLGNGETTGTTTRVEGSGDSVDLELPAAASKNKRLVLIGLAALCLLGVGLWLSLPQPEAPVVVPNPPPSDSSPPVASIGTGTPAAPTSVPSTAPSATGDDATSTDDDSVTDLDKAKQGDDETTGTTKVPSPKTHAKPVPTIRRPVRPAKPDPCKNPTYIDANGIKRIKKGC
jgi:serine/threonine-protein kinase